MRFNREFFLLPLVVVAAVKWLAAAWRKEGGGFLMEGWLARRYNSELGLLPPIYEERDSPIFRG